MSLKVRFHLEAQHKRVGEGMRCSGVNDILQVGHEAQTLGNREVVTRLDDSLMALNADCLAREEKPE